MEELEKLAVGLYNELIAQAQFVKDPIKIVFVPVMGKGPIDMVVLDIEDRRVSSL
jgi:hypothetical protein